MCIAHVAYLGINKERWHSVPLVRNGSTKIVYTFPMWFSWTLCLSGHAVTASSFSLRNSRSYLDYAQCHDLVNFVIIDIIIIEHV